jgi:hypothetical protein
MPDDDAALGAQSAVLENDALLERIVSAGALSTPELAAAALVSRRWRRVTTVDALWRPAWRREAPSLRGLEERVGRGAGFRASLAQLRESVSLARAAATAAPQWRLADFTFAVDVTWRGKPLFAAATCAELIEEQSNESTLQFENTLPASTDATNLMRRVLHGEDFAGLQLRMLLLRADGAVACIVADAKGNYGDDGSNALQALWQSEQLPETRGDLRTLTDAQGSQASFIIDWDFYLVCIPADSSSSEEETDEDAAVQPAAVYFRTARLHLKFFHREWERSVKANDLRWALATSSLRWVLPRRLSAAAKRGSDAAPVNSGDHGAARS